MVRRVEISPCGKYRYILERFWEPWSISRCVLTVCMLNPSTADGYRDDATIRWLIGWAKKHGYGGLRVVNLAAFRATSPKDMLAASDPHGPENASYLAAICSGKMVLCAWGVNGSRLPKYDAMLRAMGGVQFRCLTTTGGGAPAHPLRKSHSLELQPWADEARR